METPFCSAFAETDVNPLVYNEFGMLIFLDLLPRAKKAAKAEIEMKNAKQHYMNLAEKYNRLGDWKDEEYNLEI